MSPSSRALSEKRLVELTLIEARKGYKLVYPNPPVGALLVKNNQIIAKGFHGESGNKHAEIVAMEKVSEQDLVDSTLYVSLEPCNHVGKTGPCSEAILQSPILNVVYAARDLNAEAQGGAIFLEKNKRAVKHFYCRQAENLLRPWQKYKIEKKITIVYWVIASLNGYVLNEENLRDGNLGIPPNLIRQVQHFVEKVRSSTQKEIRFEVPKGAYHFSSPLEFQEAHLGKDVEAYLNILRLPIYLEQSRLASGLSVIGSLNLSTSNRFGNCVFERYTVSKRGVEPLKTLKSMLR